MSYIPTNEIQFLLNVVYLLHNIWIKHSRSNYILGDNWCDDALEAEKFGMEVVVQLPAAALR